MRVLIADDTLGSMCEQPAVGIAALGQPAFDSLSLVLDVLDAAESGVDALRGLAFLDLRIDPDPPGQIVISTEHVRLSLAPLTPTSTGAHAMASDHIPAPRTFTALQLREITALGRDDNSTSPATARRSPRAARR